MVLIAQQGTFGHWLVMFLTHGGDPVLLPAANMTEMSGLYSDRDPLPGYTYIEGATE